MTNLFSNAELADIHFTYGRANGNCREAQRLYRMAFPNRRCPAKDTFAAVHRRLRETGSFSPVTTERGRARRVRTPALEERVLDMVVADPRTSTRRVAADVGASHSTVWRICRQEQLYPYHVQRVQALSPADFPPRVTFAQWLLHQCTEPGFLHCVLFTDEAQFQRDGVVNFHNMHHWARENPHEITQSRHQQRFHLNVWIGTIGDYLIGPFFLPPTLNGQLYQHFLEGELPALLEDVPLATRRRMWFMHDGAPAHFRLTVREHLNRTYPGRWIGRGGPIAWPPRSPDMNPLDFFVWGQLKADVYATPVPNEQALHQRIVDGCTKIQNTPGLLERVRQSLRRRCEACIAAHGAHFEHLL